ncbi:MAG: recombinase family protein [Clostridia bacterium]
MKIAIYSRKSKFTGKGESIDNQIELCRQYIASHIGTNMEIVTFEDEGFSGGHLDRPQFQEMMKQVRYHQFSHIVCYRLDRISRNISDFASLIEELTSLECGFVSIKEQFDTANPMGRAMMFIASVFSQLERETIAERIRDNMHELAKTGRWLGGISPTGYNSQSVENVTIDGKVHKSAMLVKNKDEESLIHLIFDTFLDTNSLSAVETLLLQKHIKTRRGKNFTRFAVRNILTNPVYMIADEYAFSYFNKLTNELFAEEKEFDGTCGMMVYNRTIQKRGKTNETRAISDWIVSVGKHKGYIDGKTWIKIQDNLEENKSKSYRKPRSHVALLSGVIRCDSCGDYMRPKLTSRQNDKGEFIYSYLCSTKEKSKSHNCQMKNPNGNMLDKLVCDEIKKLSAEPSEFLKGLEECKKSLRVSTNGSEKNRLSDKLKEVENDLKSLISTLPRFEGTDTEEYMLEQIENLTLESKQLKISITEIEELNSEHELTDIEFDLLRDILSSFANTFDEMSVEQRRLAIKTFVTKVLWDGENVHIHLFGSTQNKCEPSCDNSERDINAFSLG